MSRLHTLLVIIFLCGWGMGSAHAQIPDSSIPDALRPWKDWALWDSPHLACPSPFDNAKERICLWPSALELSVAATEGDWNLEVRAFGPSWLPLPGDDECWPQAVQVDNQVVPVVAREGVPSIYLTAGLHSVRGRFLFQRQPEKIAVPPTIGIVSLTLDGAEVRLPNRDASGLLWLRRSQASAEEKDQLSLQVYRVLEDGLPLWLRTELEVSVSGKSREEDLGFILPANWQLSYVNSPLPVALDESGRLKAQVRAGNWKIRIDAFRNEDQRELQYLADTPPAVATELIALRARPDLRVIELQSATPVDVSLTTFPEDWRDLPVFQWTPESPLVWTVKSSGAGEARPNRFKMNRELWLDDNGQSLTYQDEIRGESRQISRLDAASGNTLAVVRIDGERQLITRNPTSQAPGIELRTRLPNITAIGRLDGGERFSATGWQSNADSLQLSLNLPPGWRMLALFGADRVEGDWLTAWTLLDLFLLLIFSLAIFRLWGPAAGLIAFLAFGLAYHEAGAPRLTWLFLLMPVAILQAVRPGRLSAWLQVWRNIALGLLLLFLVPFLVREIQAALYPQLERAGIQYQEREFGDFPFLAMRPAATNYQVASEVEMNHLPEFDSAPLERGKGRGKVVDRSPAQQQQLAGQKSNMMFDPGTSIQTGIAKPDWRGNLVLCYWDGPVSSEQMLRPILMSATQHRLLIVGRIILLCLLLGMFFRKPSARTRTGGSGRTARATAAGSVILLALSLGGQVGAQEIPDAETLRLLRERLSQPSEAFPRAAEIPLLRANIVADKLTCEGQIHAAADCAIPLPGEFPVWSPLSIRLGDSAGVVCRREDGYLWLWVPQGVHVLKVEGLLPDKSEWVWAFPLRPRQLQLDAPDWNVTGLRPDGRPEAQLFFSRKERTVAGDSNYDQRNFRAVVQVDRQLEIGLVWKVHNTIRRLSAPGRALTVQIPLLEDERVLSGNVVPRDGQVEINLGAEDTEFSWESELPARPEVRLEAKPQPQTVERWSLLTSPVWNVRPSGSQPIYESSSMELVPVWYPWPGEQVTLAIERPVAVDGKTLTIKQASQTLEIGNRQRNSKLEFQVESSLGNEFGVELPTGAEVLDLQVGGRPLPVRREGNRVLIGLQPGSQNVKLEWTSPEAMSLRAEFPAVQLPIEAANLTSIMQVPQSRWILWAHGPLRGPAVRFWVIVLFAALLGWGLSRHPLSPLRGYEWVLLALGLTQIHFTGGLLIVLWLFLLAWRGRRDPATIHWLRFDFTQLGLIALTIVALVILINVVSRGLLGQPEMFIAGNGSSAGRLIWFTPESSTELTRPGIFSVSIWYYRLLMLAWALWLANAVIRWLQLGWQNFTSGGAWRGRPRVVKPEEKGPEPSAESAG